MLKVLLVLLSISLFVVNAFGQQSPQTHSPQTYTPQTYSPQGYPPQGFAPQTGSSEAQTSAPPRLRLFKCVADDDERNSCRFYSGRDLKSGNPCTCNGSAGTIY